MQTIPSKKRVPPKTFIIVFASILLIAGGLVAYMALPKSQPSVQEGAQPGPASSNTTGEKSGADNSEVVTSDSTKNETKAPAPNNSLTVTFTSWTNTRVRVLIGGVVDGTCSLELTKAGAQTINMSVKTQSGPSSSTCEGFDYDALSGGGWTATVSVVAGTLQGTASKDIE